jgi:hypothetical protein
VKTYSIDTIQKITNQYIDKGGQVIELIDGVLGYGTTICFGDKLKFCVIQERFQTSWSSVHTIRFYKSTPKKYQSIVNK